MAEAQIEIIVLSGHTRLTDCAKEKAAYAAIFKLPRSGFVQLYGCSDLVWSNNIFVLIDGRMLVRKHLVIPHAVLTRPRNWRAERYLALEGR